MTDFSSLPPLSAQDKLIEMHNFGGDVSCWSNHTLGRDSEWRVGYEYSRGLQKIEIKAYASTLDAAVARVYREFLGSREDRVAPPRTRERKVARSFLASLFNRKGD